MTLTVRWMAATALLAGAAVLTGASTVHAGAGSRMTVIHEREAAGEPCAICGRALEPGDKAMQVKGRWVPLHRGACSHEFEANPATAFAAMQPRGALFDESFRRPSPLRWTWFLAGGWVLLGLLCGGVASHMAYPRGRDPLVWFGAGLAANFAAIAILAITARPARSVPPGLGKMHATADPIPCASCGAPSHPSAKRCLSCGAVIASAGESEAARAARASL